MFQLTPYFADIEQQIAGVTSLPIFWSEFYGDDDPATDVIDQISSQVAAQIPPPPEDPRACYRTREVPQ